MKSSKLYLKHNKKNTQHASSLHQVASSAFFFFFLDVHLKVDSGLALFILAGSLCCDTMPYSLGSDSLVA